MGLHSSCANCAISSGLKPSSAAGAGAISMLALGLAMVFDVVVDELDFELLFVDDGVDDKEDAEENGRLSSFPRSLH